ncbi:MAG: sensor histidine kinase [Bacteroidales bacterium]|nr:sensor histidine kinase [Bacteroidales bacterium]
MKEIQYDRQKLYFKWALILCIIALIGYSFYFEYDRFTEGVKILSNNISLFIRSLLVFYFLILLIFLNKISKKVFSLLGFLILIPLSWSISVISFLTIGYEGITVTGFIFLILASAVVFDFNPLQFLVALLLILSFHFVLLSFYPEYQPKGLFNHIFLLSLSGILGVTINYMVNIIKKNETNVLEERELLLKEIHHRVKNNLQVISSILNLQSGSISDENAQIIVKEGQSRVKSMALIHQLLYQTDSFTTIDFGKYLKQLMVSLHNTFSKPENKISYIINTDNTQLDIDTAVPLGLITNELVTNAYKHAFVGRSEGKIDIHFKNTPQKNVVLRIKDNGKGFPKDFDLEESQTLGLKLVKLLTRQMNADLKYQLNDGVEFKLVISKME